MPPGVRCIWTLRDDAAGPRELQRVVPDGCVELVLNFGDRFREHAEDGAVSQPHALIATNAARPIVLEPTGRIDILAVRFEPGAAAAFLGAAMRELGGRTWDLADVAPSLRSLVERAEGAKERRSEVEQALTRAFKPRLAPDRRVQAAVGLIAAHRGRIAIDDVTHLAGVAPRWLQRHFNQSLGFGPKVLARLARFQSLLATLEGRRGQWARAAAEAGYYDQSHLIRDFRRFTGVSPEVFLSEPNAMAELFVAG